MYGSASCDTKRTSATSCVDAGASKLYDSVVEMFSAPARRRAMCVPVSGNKDCPRLLDVLRTTPTSSLGLATKGASKPSSKPLAMHRTGPSTVGIAVCEGLGVSVAVWELLEVPVPDAVCEEDAVDVCDDDGVAVLEGLAVRELVCVGVCVELSDAVPVDVAEGDAVRVDVAEDVTELVDVAEDVMELVGVMLDVAVVLAEEVRVAVTLELALDVALTEAVDEAVSLEVTDAVVVALDVAVMVDVDDVVARALNEALAEGVTLAVDDDEDVDDCVGVSVAT